MPGTPARVTTELLGTFGQDHGPVCFRRRRGSITLTADAADRGGRGQPRPRARGRDANHASNRQHPSREADTGGLARGSPQWPASLFPACLADSGRHDRGIVAVALQKRPRYRPLTGQARALSAARICYDHLAGRLSVDLTDSSSPENMSCSTTTKPLKSRRQVCGFSLSSGSSFPHGVRPAAAFADSASIGPSDAHTSRVR
jgi:hypothetical protein